MLEKNAREAVEQAISESTDAKQISIHQFWMALYEYGYEVVPRSDAIQPKEQLRREIVRNLSGGAHIDGCTHPNDDLVVHPNGPLKCLRCGARISTGDRL